MWVYGQGFNKVGYIRDSDGNIVKEGWGGSLKPAWEPILLFRKPLSERTVAANVLRWGTGALNIDGCRIESTTHDQEYMSERMLSWNKAYPPGEGKRAIVLCGSADGSLHNGDRTLFDPSKGRWPANIVHDGSDEVLACFPDAPGQQRYVGPEHGNRDSVNCYGDYGARPPTEPRDDGGSAARFFASFPNGLRQPLSRDGEPSADRRYAGEGGTDFAALPGARREGVEPHRLFYCSKAADDERLGSRHPTIKPVDPVAWLCRLVAPRGAAILDPFAGSGTTGEAAFREGCTAVLIEREVEYCDDIRRRMRLSMAGPDERAYAIAKQKAKGKPLDAGPLFDPQENAALAR
jgi:site-specific DNA-methyltransferase (adenine-specific)